jgi:hypothetical protein
MMFPAALYITKPVLAMLPIISSQKRGTFDSGDHLHPGEQGNRAMAEGVDLDALLGCRISQQ